MTNEKSFFGKLKTYLIYAGPGTFAFFTVMIIPFIYGIYLTFTNWNGISDAHNFIGFQNYSEVFKDGVFWTSLWLTLKYAIASCSNYECNSIFTCICINNWNERSKFL